MSTKKKIIKEKKNKTKKRSTIDIMEDFKTNGISVLDTLNKHELSKIIKEANKQYHSHKATPFFTDAEYDIIKEYLEKKFPDAEILQEVGAEVLGKQKVNLPINMPSMDKIKPDTEALTQWTRKYKGPYVLSCKLDGVSGLYYTMKGNKNLYTRGNGKVGQDVSHLLKAISLPTIKDVIVRGEFIVSKSTFDTKYSQDFANIRNMVAGIINRKSVDKKAKDVDFIAYEVIQPALNPSEQMSFLFKHGFKTVQNETKTKITNETLSQILVDWRENYVYEIDGVIVADNHIHTRLEGNPDHAFAFKMVISDQIAETHVTDVIWTASKDGYLKPRVRVNPVHIGGVKIEYATGFNGQYIESNKIGIGAIIQLVRSGDVIPYIKSVTTPAEVAKMPDIPYIWTDSHVDIMLANKQDDPVVLEKRITAFFTGIEVDGLSSGNVKRLIQGGYNTIPKILQMREQDFLGIEGFKEKLAHKIFTSIHSKLKSSSLSRIISASGTMGRGIAEKKLKPVFQKYPRILVSSESPLEKQNMLLQVDGIGKENAKMFVDNIPEVVKFLTECQLMNPETGVPCFTVENESNPEEQTEPIVQMNSHPLYGKKIIFTGFRDKELMNILEKSYNVSFGSSISKNIQIVIVKTMEESNKKIDQAKSLNIPVFTIDEFRNKYSL